MVEVGNNLAFASEASHDFIRVCAALQKFDRNILLEFAVRPCRQEYRSHSSAPNFTHYLISTDSRSHPGDSIPKGIAEIVRTGIELLAGNAQIRFHLLAELRVVRAGLR